MRVEFDYTRSLGPVLSGFMTGLRDRTVLGGRVRHGRTELMGKQLAAVVGVGQTLDGTVVTSKLDGIPRRMLRTDLVDELERTSSLRRLGPTLRRTLEFRRTSGLSWRQLLADGRSMRRGNDRSWSQMMVAANTPMMLKAGLVEGRTDAGVLAAGQVVGVIDDLPSCEELVDRVVTEAAARLRQVGTLLP